MGVVNAQPLLLGGNFTPSRERARGMQIVIVGCRYVGRHRDAVETSAFVLPIASEVLLRQRHLGDILDEALARQRLRQDV